MFSAIMFSAIMFSAIMFSAIHRPYKSDHINLEALSIKATFQPIESIGLMFLFIFVYKLGTFNDLFEKCIKFVVYNSGLNKHNKQRFPSH